MFFWLDPSNWKLKGKEREIALAKHRIKDGYELETTINKIEYGNNLHELTEHQNQIDLKYGKISEGEFKYRQAVLNDDAEGVKLAKLVIEFEKGEIEESEFLIREQELLGNAEGILNLKHEYGMITDEEYKKSLAGVRGEPYVNIEVINNDPNDPASVVSFEFDWNDTWIIELKKAGYTGSDDDIMNSWFMNVCHSVLSEDITHGLYNFNGNMATTESRNNDNTTDIF